jgi:uroporphyrinogen decarboxylase
MVEGSGSDDWRTLKKLRYSRPELLHHILEVNARAVIAYLNAQIEAGAQAVMLFDTWGGILANRDYETFSLAYSRKVIAGLLKENDGVRVPNILFTKGGNPWLAAMLASGCDALGLDWTSDPREARRIAAGRVALQGNLDPAALFAPPESVREAARRVIDAFGIAPGHVFNLGHGILTQTPVDSVSALVDEVRTYSRSLHSKSARQP